MNRRSKDKFCTRWRRNGVIAYGEWCWLTLLAELSFFEMLVCVLLSSSLACTRRLGLTCADWQSA